MTPTNLKNKIMEADKSISLQVVQIDFNKKTYFNSEDEENDDYLDDEQDDFFYSYDAEEIEDNYDGFEFDNFD